MAVKLFDNQKDAVDRLRPGCILCGGVGSGKSITALDYYFEKICGGVFNEKGRPLKMDSPTDLYIITTAKKRDNKEWSKECFNFILCDGKPECSIENVNVVIDSWNNIHKYINIQNVFFILDEQRLVGNGTWVSSFLKIAKNNKWILLSATPGDCWMDYIPVFLANGFYKNRKEFVMNHVVYNPYVKFPKVSRYINENLLRKYLKKILVTMDYTSSKEHINYTIKCHYDKDLEDVVLNKRWNYIEQRPIQNLSQLTYLLRQIDSIDDDRINNLLEIILEHNAIIFYNFNSEREKIISMLNQNNITFGEWNGFNHTDIPNSDRWVYLVQYTAGCEGWECTKTDTIVFYSQTYSYKTKTQAAGRIDRLNSPFTKLYYYNLVSDSEIDKAIKNCLDRKKKFNEKIFINQFEK